MADLEDLDVSRPTFDENGIHFSLNDHRPNKAIWVSVDLFKGDDKKYLMSWFKAGKTEPGPISIGYEDCKYLDGGIDIVRSATDCKVTIGTQLENDDRAYVTFSIPTSEMPKALIDAANKP